MDFHTFLYKKTLFMERNSFKLKKNKSSNLKMKTYFHFPCTLQRNYTRHLQIMHIDQIIKSNDDKTVKMCYCLGTRDANTQNDGHLVTIKA